MDFKTYFRLAELAQVDGGAILSTSWTGSEALDTMSLSGHPSHLPGLDLALPSITKQGLVVKIIQDKNPIFIQLDDGTVLLFNIDEFKRICGDKDIQPNQSRLRVVFQRNPKDTSMMPSQIQSCQLL